MAEYSNDDDALVGLAWQLTDAYSEALGREDQDYACDAISDYLGEYRHVAPAEALLALLDLPLTAETFPLVDEAQATLAGRGSAVVQLLLAATLGEVYDPHGPAPERAAETLDSMDRGDVAVGLIEVLCGEADDDLKDAAVDGLAALGGIAEPDLVAALDDPVGGAWADAALARLRAAREQPREAGDGGSCDPVRGSANDRIDEAPARGPGAAPAGSSAPDDGEPPAAPDEPPAGGSAGPTATDRPPAPDQGLVDDAYEDFLRRFEQESGEGSEGPARP